MSGGVRERLRRWLGITGDAAPQPRCADSVDQAPANPTPVSTSDSAAASVPTPADLAGLEKQIARMGREQYKLNMAVEAQQQQIQAALQLWREQGERREQELAGLRASRPVELANAQQEARLRLAQQLLPVLDGLDEALAAADRLQARLPSAEEKPQAQPQTSERPAPWAVDLAVPIAWLAARLGRHEPAAPVAQPAGNAEWLADYRAAYSGWLRGLQLVRERLLDTLSGEGVRPIQSIGQPFDPRWHVALDTAAPGPGTPPGTVVAETRRGYIAGERVLRYAEVIVAREPQPASEQEPEHAPDAQPATPVENH
jgi:molecular chaperone GrpE (heat shock protein)